MAVILATRTVTYRQFERSINGFAATLAPLVRRGSVVAIIADNRYVHWLFILALNRVGAVSVSIEPKLSASLIPLVSPDLVIADEGIFVPDGFESLRVNQAWVDAALARADERLDLPRTRPDDPARIATSSGTSGVPKRMLFSNKDVVQRVRTGVFGQVMRHDPSSIVVIGVDTFGGFGAVLRCWWFGGAAGMIRATPENLLVHDIRGLVISPRQLQSMLLRLPQDFAPLNQLTITVGGSALPKAVGLEARLRLSPNILLSYGSTETSTVAVAPLSARDRDPDLTGIVLPFAEVEIVDAQDRALPHGQVGEIRIRTAEMVKDYLGDPETSARRFRDGWFYSGDTGSLDRDGGLRVIGRIDDVLNFSGAKISPDRVEEAIAGAGLVADQAVFSVVDQAGIEQPWVAVVAAAGYDADGLRNTVGTFMPWARNRLRVLRVPAIPRNAMGKIERFKLRQMAATTVAAQRVASPGAQLPPT